MISRATLCRGISAATFTSAALMLAACVSTGTSATTASALPLERSQAGGAFSASYSGTVSSKSCGFKCTKETLTGSGRASFLHKSTQAETLTIECAVEACSATGFATLTSDSHPLNAITIYLASETQGEIDYGTWYVTGGTGKFANASGSGYWHTSYGTGTYSQTLSGTLTF